MTDGNKPRRFGDGCKVEWNAVTTELLKTMWLDGFSALRIAEQIGGGCTRNAAIGKINRMGLMGVLRANKKPRAPSEPAAVKAVFIEPMTIEAPPAPALELSPAFLIESEPPPFVPEVDEDLGDIFGPLITFRNLESHHCRFIAGQPDGLETVFCGEPKAHGQSWCADHLKILGGKRHEAAATDGRFRKSTMTGIFS